MAPDEVEAVLKEHLKAWTRPPISKNDRIEIALTSAISIIQDYQKFRERVSVGKIENMLEEKFNHLFSPEEDYLGRLNVAQAIVTFLEGV